MAAERRLLHRDPARPVERLAELVGIADAVEREAIRRYRWLADEMRRRGEDRTAEAFEIMAAEEASHVAAVAAWAEQLGETAMPEREIAWRLPAELGESWEEAVGSTLLTPYRAYAIAVQNEERAFAFYSYLAASSPDPGIAREAEHLAQEELRHAARLRISRRAAWRRESAGREAAWTGRWHPRDTGELAALLAAAEADMAGCHRLLADRLKAAGDAESAGLLEELAAEAAARASAGVAEPSCSLAACRSERPADLLRAAQRPLERLCEQLELLHLTAATEAQQSMAEAFLADAVARIARIGRRLEAVESGG